MKDESMYLVPGIRRPVIVPDRLRGRLECPWSRCPTVTQGGSAGLAAHLKCVHGDRWPS